MNWLLKIDMGMILQPHPQHVTPPHHTAALWHSYGAKLDMSSYGLWGRVWRSFPGAWSM